MRVSASASWRETTDCGSVCLKGVNLMPAKGIGLWAMVAPMPGANQSRWESQNQQVESRARVTGPVCTGRSHLEDKMFIFSSKLVSECVCICVCAHVCMCMCSSLAHFRLDYLASTRHRIWASILDELRSHAAVEGIHKSVSPCETEDKEAVYLY